MVVADPEIMGGAPVFKGTRIPVDLVADMLAQGATSKEILEGYPTLNKEMIAFAPRYMRAFPRRGRPSRRPWRGEKARGRKSFPLKLSAWECMRFLIDECLHESLVGVAHRAGFDATHVNHLGLSGKPDWDLAARIVKDEFVFVTNNRADFIRLFRKMDLHAGLIRIVPNGVPLVQRALFEAAIQYLSGRELTNSAIEVSLKKKAVVCVEYQLPKD